LFSVLKETISLLLFNALSSGRFCSVSFCVWALFDVALLLATFCLARFCHIFTATNVAAEFLNYKTCSDLFQKCKNIFMSNFIFKRVSLVSTNKLIVKRGLDSNGSEHFGWLSGVTMSRPITA